MLLEVGKFCETVQDNLSGLIDELANVTNRHSNNEILAWQKSLPMLSVALSAPSLKDFHISLGHSGGISLEYKLPAASAWCDAVLLGMGKVVPSAVMIELKNWDSKGIKPASRENLVDYHGVLVSHPSDQVRGYVEYCQNFHSTVLKENATVVGCVFFTNAHDLDTYRQFPYTDLVSEYPVFSSKDNDIHSIFPNFLAQYLKKPDFTFAQNFESGSYAQNRCLIEQIADLILDDQKTIFILLDEQRRGYEFCLAEIDEVLNNANTEDKTVIIIEGPPGSGKSVLAAKLWATLSKNSAIKNSVVMTSTSSSQNTNWSTLFQKQTNTRLGKGVIIKSTQYNPGLTPSWVLKMRKKGFGIAVNDWHNNVKLFLDENNNRMPDNHIEISIVDEAHALIDPSTPNKEGVGFSGWCAHAGPQAYHIIRVSQISIFLMDPLQSYRDNETTTKESIEIWSKELGVKNIRYISLGDAQFRCGGSKEYIYWLNDLLGLEKGKQDGISWKKKENHQGGFHFNIVDDPKQLDEELSIQINKRKTVRLVATYSRKWKTKNVAEPHSLSGEKMDFHIPYQRNGQKEFWSRIWNFAPEQKYQLFVQAIPGSRMELDPLCEVGCPYVVRGFDYDYLGVLWLKDLVWRNDKWKVNLDNIYETAWNITLSRARHESKTGVTGPYTNAIIRQLQQGYRILLSRAINGVFVWFEDEETHDHVVSSIK